MAKRYVVNGDSAVRALELLAERRAERPELLGLVMDALERGACLLVAKVVDGAATGTSEFQVRYEPSDWFLNLMGAALTPDGDLNLVGERFGQGASPSSGVCTA